MFIFLKQAQDKKWLVAFLSFLCIFLCFGYMTGTDWRNYEYMYDSINLNRLFYDYYAEPGFYLYMLPFKTLDIDFFNFLVFTKVWCFCSIFYIMTKYAEEYKYVSIMYFLPWYSFYLFIDNPLRNLMSVSIMMMALPLLKNRRILPYILMTLLATSMHITAIIMLPIYFLLTRNVSSWVWVLLFIVFNLIFADRAFLVMIISKLFGGIPYIAEKMTRYFEMNNEFSRGRVLSLGMIIHTLYFVLLIYYRKLFMKLEHGKLIFAGAIIYLLFYRLATTIEVFMRFQLYFAVFFVIAISLLVRAFARKSRVVYLTALLIISFIPCQTLFKDYRYIPYTNYLVYVIKGDFPSYTYRSSYNMNNSPYKNAKK